MATLLRTTSVIALGAVVLFSVGAHAQQSGAVPGALTALDYFEIQQLNERYVHAIDNCIENGYEYASLYSRDGVFIDLWSDAGVAQGGIRWQGPAKLMEVSGGGVNGCKGWQRRSDAISYMITGLVITPSPEGATGKAYLIAVGVNGDPHAVEREGSYEDVYVKTATGWRFQERAHVRKRAMGDPRS
jgi:hypothetical protein